MRRRAGLAARIAFGVLGGVFIVVAFVATLGDAQDLEAPAWHLFAAAVLLYGAGLWCAYRAWVALLEVSANPPLAAGFYLSQLGKYVPGGVWQALAQAGYAARAGIPGARAGTRLVVFGLTQAAGGAVVGATLVALGSGVSGILRAGSVVPLLVLVALLDRRWMIRAVRWWQLRRGGAARDDLIPRQGAIVTAALWSTATMVLASASFALLLSGTTGDAVLASAVPAFALAWTIGFLAVPFPAGLGVREAVLVAALVGVAPTAAILAASVFLRLVAIAAEGVAIGASLSLARFRTGPAPGPRPESDGGPPIPPPRLRFMGESEEEFVEIGDALLATLERRAALGESSRVLDVGCGYGRLAHALLRRGFAGRYLGVDVLEPHIEWCAANLADGGVEFRRVDIRNERYNPAGTRDPGELDLGGERFDVVALFSVFTHMWPNDVSAYLRLIDAALAPQGRALATFFLLDDEWRRLEAAGSPEFRLPLERTPFCRYESADEPLHRVGYELDWVLAAAHEAGLAPVGAPAFGSWSGRRGEAGYQDVITFARAGERARR
jgi:SAM-dependent methyltransferase